jgi:mannose-1-phosphate guanylyltransferase/mannose-1-phosphate guanylyltransferase/mannose-6-phosphate isomerase
MVEMKPGEEGSLQSHQGFDELWILLTSNGEVQVGEQILNPQAYEEIYIPRGTKHRLRNSSSETLRMMEVVWGKVRDDDKVRYEDKYDRGQP